MTKGAKEKGEGSARWPGKRKDHKYAPAHCDDTGKAGCEEVGDWGQAWYEWGVKLLEELDEMKQAICNLEKKVYYGVEIPQKGTICDARGPIVTGGGGPPTDTTQPPKPPYKP
jgi:hypothetical protein